MDQSKIDLWCGPADRSYVGIDHTDICDVEQLKWNARGHNCKQHRQKITCIVID